MNTNLLDTILNKLHDKGFREELRLIDKRFVFPGSNELLAMEDLKIIEYHALPDEEQPGNKVIVCAVTDNSGKKGILITR